MKKMLVLDANLLIGVFRDDDPRHPVTSAWFEDIARRHVAFTVPDVCFSALVRITTNPRAFPDPSPMAKALEFANQVRSRPGFRQVQPGAGLWPLFMSYCSLPGVRGNHVTDAYLAAFAAERSDELVTLDRGFARFPGLRWRHPIEP